jgi:hypothetical protein
VISQKFASAARVRFNQWLLDAIIGAADRAPKLAATTGNWALEKSDFHAD